MGPLLFALALQPVLQRLNATRSAGGLQLVFSYLDDCCLAGSAHAVATAAAELRAECARIGLELNGSKCEVIPTAGLHSNVDRTLFPSDFAFNPTGDFELLGGPIGTQEYCNQHTQERVAKAIPLLTALGELPDPQVALLLLRHCASFGKLVYSARVVPHTAHASALRSFDEAVRECVEAFMCCSFSADEWALATLSTKLSGLGLRSASQHSSAAFLSSRARCHSLCRKLDPEHVWEIDSSDSAVALASADYNQKVSDADVLTAEHFTQRTPLEPQNPIADSAVPPQQQPQHQPNLLPHVVPAQPGSTSAQPAPADTLDFRNPPLDSQNQRPDSVLAAQKPQNQQQLPPQLPQAHTGTPPLGAEPQRPQAPGTTAAAATNRPTGSATAVSSYRRPPPQPTQAKTGQRPKRPCPL